MANEPQTQVELKKPRLPRINITPVEYDLYTQISKRATDPKQIGRYIWNNSINSRVEDMPNELRSRYQLAAFGPNGNQMEGWLQYRVRSLATMARYCI